MGGGWGWERKEMGKRVGGEVSLAASVTIALKDFKKFAFPPHV